MTTHNYLGLRSKHARQVGVSRAEDRCHRQVHCCREVAEAGVDRDCASTAGNLIHQLGERRLLENTTLVACENLLGALGFDGITCGQQNVISALIHQRRQLLPAG